MVTIRLSVYGDVQLERTLLRFADHAKDLRPAWDDLHEDFFSIEKEQFESEGTSGSGGWQALKPATIRAKAARGQRTEILQRTGDLMESLTSDGGGHFYRSEPNSVWMGSSVKYGKYHQTGAPRANVPQRRPVELTESQRQAWVRKIQAFLVEGE